MKKTIFTIIALLTLFSFNHSAFAAGDKPSKKPAEPANIELTAEQESALYVMTTEYLRERQPIEKDLAQKQAQYRALMRHTNPSIEQAGELAADIAGLEYTLMVMSMRFHNQLAHNFNMPMKNCTNGNCADNRKRGAH